FDMYFTTKPAGEGTGMGLGIALTIAREHGGDIGVDSTIGVGTTFTVTLPIDRP
ncbi:MAG: HAMP domain-containing histidine kinase, partial [Proteobacteria bacterium]|nr:HAMP domain-containing histidine kinase [Pseudomonadota bacterium]